MDLLAINAAAAAAVSTIELGDETTIKCLERIPTAGVEVAPLVYLGFIRTIELHKTLTDRAIINLPVTVCVARSIGETEAQTMLLDVVARIAGAVDAALAAVEAPPWAEAFSIGIDNFRATDLEVDQGIPVVAADVQLVIYG